jgi:hypothetical protein
MSPKHHAFGLCIVLGLGLGASACGSDSSAGASGAAPADGTGGPFLAFGTSFQGFHDWKSTPASSTVPVGIHVAGPMTVFLNKAPPKGSTAFPLGTIIVKEVDGGDPLARTIFAMVKRGAGFNPDGAHEWEWFELQNTSSGVPLIVWRGVGPPAGEKYGGDANGGCNGCHSAGKDNDFVLTSGLLLSSF